MLTQLIDLLHRLDLDPTAKEIGEMLWLADYLDAPNRETLETTDASKVNNRSRLDHARQTPLMPKIPQSDSAAEIRSSVEQPTVAEEPQAKLYSGRAQEEVATGGIRGIDFRSPGVPALSGALELARALRPFKRTTLSRTKHIFDEKASIDAAADAGNPVPILRPAPSRWLDVVLVVDESPSMVIWRATIQEFQRLLERQGAFRNVQLWRLQYESEDSDPRLQIGVGNGHEQRAHKASELIDTSGQRLILVVTDCVSPAWDRARIATLLKTWQTWGPVALVQMLPKYLWSRTALGNMPEVHLRAKLPGLPNAQLDIKWLLDEYDDVLRQWLQSQENQTAGMVVPVVTLEPRSLASWSTALATGNSAWITGFFLPTVPLPPPLEDEFGAEIDSVDELPDASTLVESFNRTASPTARKLARYLAAAPLTLPVMRLVQGTMLPDSLQVHLAEVFLSGLIARQTPETADIALDDFQYEFVDGVQEVLLASSRISTTIDVLSLVSEYIGERIGQPLDFRAWLAASLENEGNVVVQVNQYFATIKSKLLNYLADRHFIPEAQLDETLNNENLPNVLNDYTSALKIANKAESGIQVLMDSALTLGNKDDNSGKSYFPVNVEHIQQALRQWHQREPSENRLNQLYIYRKLCRERKIAGRLATNALLLAGLERLQEKDEVAAKLLRNRYLDGLTIAQTAHQRNIAERTIFSLQRQACNQLADILWSEELTTYSEQQRIMLQRLDFLKEDHLVGAERSLAALLPLFESGQQSRLIAIEGLGGIGKTTLANALLRRLIAEHRVDDIGWVSARQQRFNPNGEVQQVAQPALTADQLIEALIKQLLPGLGYSPPQQRQRALQSHLSETPHVIVIDNLETLLDVETLLPTLHQLANPTRFLLTSRESFFGEQTLYHFKLPELDQTDSLLLIRQEASWNNLPLLTSASDETLRPIYEIVGGNPLALRLVVGQTHLYSLDSILTDLKEGRSGTIENFYTYIYWKAWQRLDEVHRRALLAMPLANPEGDELDYLAEIGELDLNEMRMALNRLVNLNLVNIYGGLNERRYAIHSLTRTFLTQQYRVRDWATDFESIILQGMRTVLTQLQQDNETLPSDKLRQRAWLALEYALDLPNAWPLTLELLLLLAPKLEQAGYRHEWLPFLHRGLAYSEKIEARSAEGMLRTEIGLLQQLLGNLTEAQYQLEQACVCLRLAGDPERLATALDRLAEVARLQRLYTECQQLISELLGCVAADSPNAAFGYFVLGKVAFDHSQWNEAEAYFRRALAIWRPIDARHAGLCIQNLGQLAWRRAEYTAAIAYFEEAITIFCEQQDIANRALAEMNLGIVYWQRGEIAAALHYYEQAITVFREVGHRLHLAMAYNNCGLAYATIGRWAEAEEYYRLSIDLWSELGDAKSCVDPQVGLAIVYTHQTRLLEALALFAETAQQLQIIDPMQKDSHLWLELQTNWDIAKRMLADE